MKSIGSMLAQLAAMLGTRDLTMWESQFLNSVYSWSRQGTDTHRLSDKQVERIEQLYRKHFADAGEHEPPL